MAISGFPAGSGAATNLIFDPVTSTVESSTGTGAVLTPVDVTNPGLMPSADFTKLAGVAVGATANASDAALVNRANHTGTQAAGTITGLAPVATSGSASDLSAGTLPAARFDDTAHGSRAGGTLHANAVAAGAAGFMTGADKTKLDAISGTNTGDQTISLTGPITGTGTGSFATTITAGAVTLSKMADVATATVFYRKTAATGAPEVQTLATLKTDLGLTGTNSGDQTSIVGITGTKAQFDTAVTDGNVQWVGDVPTAHTHVAANITDFDAAVAANSAVALNTAKVTNATHTGEVTGSGALTIAAGAVTLAKMANLAANSVIGNATGSPAVPAAVVLASAATASAVAIRDANANAQFNNSRQGFTTTATASGTTTLTAASTYLQFFTGTLAQTVALPDVTTLVAGHQFYIRNNSTGLVTINSSGGNLLRIVGPGSRAIVTCILITGTTAASWSAMYVGITIADGKVLTVSNSLTLSGADGNALAINSATASVANTNTGDQTITLTGDVGGSGTGSFAATLATVNANVGGFGLAASVAQFTVNAKGLITAAANVAISIASTAISDSTAAGRAMLTAATATAQTALLDVFGSGTKGLAPASGGGTANFLRADGTWAAAGGGGNAVAASLAFGGTFTDKAQTVVTGQAWVAAGSKIVADVLTPSGSDPDEMYLLDFRPVVSDLVAGVGFTVTLYSEIEARGTYTVNCIGV